MEVTVQKSDGDRKILDAIYNLRVDAWEGSECRSFINRRLYPDGLKDELDEDGVHWYIEDKDSIIGCIRMNHLKSMADFPVKESFEKFAIPEGEFIYLSRVAVHPGYRHKGLALLLAETAVKAMHESPVKFALTLYGDVAFAGRFGFDYLGDTVFGRKDNQAKIKAFILNK